MSDEHERYPIGRAPRGTPATGRERVALIESIERLPSILRDLTVGLPDRDLERRYRDGGWTIRQVVHHLPDSHLHVYARMKLAVTEEVPAVSGWSEARWADLPDGRTAPVALSLDLLDALHRRWAVFLRALTEEQLRRTFRHPARGEMSVDQALAVYEWHGRHHEAHIRHALARQPQG